MRFLVVEKPVCKSLFVETRLTEAITDFSIIGRVNNLPNGYLCAEVGQTTRFPWSWLICRGCRQHLLQY